MIPIVKNNGTIIKNIKLDLLTIIKLSLLKINTRNNNPANINAKIKAILNSPNIYKIQVLLLLFIKGVWYHRCRGCIVYMLR